MKDAGLEPMAIPAICRKVKLSKLKKKTNINNYQEENQWLVSRKLS